MVALGNDIYSIGGVNENTPTYYATNYKFNTVSNTWSTMAPMAIARNDHQVTVMNNEIYVFGGDGATNYYDGIKYNPTTNLWVNITTTPILMTLGRAVTYGVDIYINASGQMWKFSSSNIERFAVERFY
jgi:N-acetylneuraminic acid mutarotase